MSVKNLGNPYLNDPVLFASLRCMAQRQLHEPNNGFSFHEILLTKKIAAINPEHSKFQKLIRDKFDACMDQTNDLILKVITRAKENKPILPKALQNRAEMNTKKQNLSPTFDHSRKANLFKKNVPPTSPTDLAAKGKQVLRGDFSSPSIFRKPSMLEIRKNDDLIQLGKGLQNDYSSPEGLDLVTEEHKNVLRRSLSPPPVLDKPFMFESIDKDDLNIASTRERNISCRSLSPPPVLDEPSMPEVLNENNLAKDFEADKVSQNVLRNEFSQSPILEISSVIIPNSLVNTPMNREQMAKPQKWFNGPFSRTAEQNRLKSYLLNTDFEPPLEPLAEASSDSVDDVLKNLNLLDKLVDGAIFIVNIFPKVGKVVFKEKQQREMLDKLVELHLAVKLGCWNRGRFSEFFDLTRGDDRFVLNTVFYKLLNITTLKIYNSNPPSFKPGVVFHQLLNIDAPRIQPLVSALDLALKDTAEIPLPLYFYSPPFNRPDSTKAFAITGLTIKYLLPDYYSEHYPEEEKQLLDLIIKAYALFEMIPLEYFETGLRIALSGKIQIQDNLLKTLVSRVKRAESSGFQVRTLQNNWHHPDRVRERLIKRILDFSSFTSLEKFTNLVEHIQKINDLREKNELSSHVSVKEYKLLLKSIELCKLLITIWDRVDTQFIPLLDAIKNTFTENGLQKLFRSKNLAGSVKKCLYLLNRIVDIQIPLKPKE